MADPDCCVPRQFPSTRRLAKGDVVFTEISAAFWDYSGQVLRSFTVDAEPTPLYRDLHKRPTPPSMRSPPCCAKARRRPMSSPPRRVIEEAGFTTNDDLMHGYGGGYLPPIIGSKSRPAGKLPDLTFKAGMMVVIQPNVDHARRQGRRADRRMRADHQDRHRAAARRAARLCARVG